MGAMRLGWLWLHIELRCAALGPLEDVVEVSWGVSGERIRQSNRSGGSQFSPHMRVVDEEGCPSSTPPARYDLMWLGS